MPLQSQLAGAGKNVGFLHPWEQPPFLTKHGRAENNFNLRINFYLELPNCRGKILSRLVMRKRSIFIFEPENFEFLGFLLEAS